LPAGLSADRRPPDENKKTIDKRPAFISVTADQGWSKPPDIRRRLQHQSAYATHMEACIMIPLVDPLVSLGKLSDKTGAIVPASPFEPNAICVSVSRRLIMQNDEDDDMDDDGFLDDDDDDELFDDDGFDDDDELLDDDDDDDDNDQQ
jgi:hypothetical protein